MQEYPHRYRAAASGGVEDVISTRSPGIEPLATTSPPEFDGPGGLWSPETMLVGSVANCFILTFRAVARGSHFDWNEVSCDVVGVLDRVDRVTRFTEFYLDVRLRLPAGSDEHKARRLAEKSEHVCLVTNSLNAEKILNITVEIDS